MGKYNDGTIYKSKLENSVTVQFSVDGGNVDISKIVYILQDIYMA